MRQQQTAYEDNGVYCKIASKCDVLASHWIKNCSNRAVSLVGIIL